MIGWNGHRDRPRWNQFSIGPGYPKQMAQAATGWLNSCAQWDYWLATIPLYHPIPLCLVAIWMLDYPQHLEKMCVLRLNFQGPSFVVRHAKKSPCKSQSSSWKKYRNRQGILIGRTKLHHRAATQNILSRCLPLPLPLSIDICTFNYLFALVFAKSIGRRCWKTCHVRRQPQKNCWTNLVCEFCQTVR